MSTLYDADGNSISLPSGGGDNVITSPVTLTVGASGQYQTLNDALQVASQMRPSYVKGGCWINVKILAGTTIAEQVSVIGNDLSFVRIIAEDSPVPVDASNFSAQGLDTHDLRGNDGAFIGGENGAGLPAIGCKFQITANTNSKSVVAYFANRGSFGVVLANSGFIGNDNHVEYYARYSDGDSGSAYAWKKDDAVLYTDTDTPRQRFTIAYTDAALQTSSGKRVYTYSSTSGIGIVVTDSVKGFNDGVISNNESSVTIREGVASHMTRWGVHARHNGEVSARSANLTYCKGIAAYADRVANLDVREAKLSYSYKAVEANNASQVCASGARCYYCGSTSASNIVSAQSGSIISCSVMYVVDPSLSTANSGAKIFSVSFGGIITIYKLNDYGATNRASTDPAFSNYGEFGMWNVASKNSLSSYGVIFADKDSYIES